MTKHKIELELEIPDGYEATGEFRCARPGEWFLGKNGAAKLWQRKATQNRYIILRKVEPREVQGPHGWPMLKWAAKDGDGQWYLFVTRPYRVSSEWTAHRLLVSASSIGWSPPPEIAGLSPEKSLTRLRHTCRWEQGERHWKTECMATAGKGRAPRYCQFCGRKVEIA